MNPLFPANIPQGQHDFMAMSSAGGFPNMLPVPPPQVLAPFPAMSLPGLTSGASAGLAETLASLQGQLMAEVDARKSSSAQDSTNEEAAQSSTEAGQLLETAAAAVPPEERDSMAKVCRDLCLLTTTDPVLLDLQKRARTLLNKGSSSRALLPPPPEASLKTAIAVFPPNTVDFARPGEGAAATDAGNGDAASSESTPGDGGKSGDDSSSSHCEADSLEMKDGEEATQEVADKPLLPRSVVVSVRLQGAPLVSFTCEGCMRNDFESQGSLSGHRRFCDGGKWRCAWCACKSHEAGGKNPGPDGPSTLCGGCGGRYRSGATGPLKQNTESGKFMCEACGREFDTAASVGGHMRFCDGGHWRCAWCECKADECSGKNPGPDGAATLCGACGARYRTGAVGPPPRDEQGRFLCTCALASHSRRCDGGNWRCKWCECKADECSGKNPGPDGPATLCGACGARYRGGATGPPPTNAEGNFLCEDCGKALETMAGLGGHRRFCDGLMAASDLVCMDPNDLLLDLSSSSSTTSSASTVGTLLSSPPDSTASSKSANGDAKIGSASSNGAAKEAVSVSSAGSLDCPIVLPRFTNDHYQALIDGQPTDDGATSASLISSSSPSWRCLQSKLTPVQVGIALSSWDLGCYVAAKVVAPSWTEAVLQRLQEDARKAEKEGAEVAAAAASSSNGKGEAPKKKTKRQSSGASAKKNKKDVDEWWREVTSPILVAPWETYAADLLHDLPNDEVGVSAHGTVPTSTDENSSSSSNNPRTNTVARGVLHALHAGLVRAVVSAPRNLFGTWTDIPASRVHGSTWLVELLRHAKDLLDARDAERAEQRAVATAEAAAAKARALKLADRRVAQFDQGPNNNNSAFDDFHHDDDDNEGAAVDAAAAGSGGNGDTGGEEGNVSATTSGDAQSMQNEDNGNGLSKGVPSSSTAIAATSSTSFGSTKALLQYKKPSRARDEVGDEGILDDSSFALLEELMSLTARARSKLSLSDDSICSSSATLAALEQGVVSDHNGDGASLESAGGSNNSSSASTMGVGLYAALSLEERVAVGDCLYNLALESHVLRANSLKSINALQTLHKCRSAEYARLPPLITSTSSGAASNGSSSSSSASSTAVVDEEAQLARRTLAQKYECLRSALGFYRRASLGSDRDGREYFVLGEQWSMLFVCEPPLNANSALPEVSSSSSSSDDVVVSEANGDDDVSSPDKMEEERDCEGLDEENPADDDEDATDNEDDEDLGSRTSSSSMVDGHGNSAATAAVDEVSVRKLFAKARADSCHKARANKGAADGATTTSAGGAINTKRVPSSRVLKASTFEESTWTVVSAPDDLRKLLTSLVSAPAYCDEARLRSVLLHLEPKLVESMELGYTSPSEGLLGAICSQCYAQTDEVLLCDGPVGQEGGNQPESPCPEEWCFKCAGVTEMPEGDWRCATCAHS